MENGRPVPAARKHLRFGDDIIVASFLGSESIIPEFSNQFHSIGNQRKTVWTIGLVRSTNITWITWRFLLPFFFLPRIRSPHPLFEAMTLIDWITKVRIIAHPPACLDFPVPWRLMLERCWCPGMPLVPLCPSLKHFLVACNHSRKTTLGRL